MKKLLLLLLFLICVETYANHWIANPNQYPNTMTMIGVVALDEIEQRSDSLEIAAFCGEECRGSVISNFHETFNRYFFYLMVYGNEGDEISFRCYDHKNDFELDMISETNINFQTNVMIGDVLEPFVFSFTSYQYQVSVDAFPEMGGVVIGEGTYKKYDTCFIEVTPNEPYQFEALIENDDTITKHHDYSFVVLSDRHFTAEFVLKEFEVSVSVNPKEGGIVSGSGIYKYGDEVSVAANPNNGYVFLNWTENDSVVSENADYKFVIISDRNIIANFEKIEEPGDDPEEPGDNPEEPGDNPEEPGDNPDEPGDNPEEPGDNPDEPGDNPDEPGDNPDEPGDNPDEPGDNPDEPGDNPEEPTESVEELVSSYNLYPNPASDFIMIENANQYDVTIYDMSGRIVLEEKPNDGRINVSHLTDGTYIVSVNKESMLVIINRR